MPFKSEQQRRFLWAKHPDIAQKWTNEYGSKPMAGNLVDPRTGKPDDKNGRDPRGGPADDIPAKGNKKFKKLTKSQAQQIAKRRVQLKQQMAQSKKHK